MNPGLAAIGTFVIFTTLVSYLMRFNEPTIFEKHPELEKMETKAFLKCTLMNTYRICLSLNHTAILTVIQMRPTNQPILQTILGK